MIMMMTVTEISFRSFSCCLFVLLPILAIIDGKPICPINHNLQVPKDPIPNPHQFRFLESSLQIFTNMRVPCNGHLKSWQFYAQNSMVYGVYLAVFRERKNASKIFDLIGTTHIYEDISRNESSNACWHSYPADPPIEVKQGDYIGIYYEKYRIRSEMLTISSIGPMDMTKAEKHRIGPSYVLLMDSYDLDRTHGVVDARQAYREYRKPALYAFFSTIIHKNSTTTPLPKLAIQDIERYTTVRNPDHNLPNPCFNSPSVSTDCWIQEQRAYFDIYQSTCETFVGCPAAHSDTEAPNNFESLNECILTCRPERQVAQLSKEPVPRQLVQFQGVPQSRYNQTFDLAEPANNNNKQ